MAANGALEVDLFAQADASRVRGTIYSGFGWQTDFVVGALQSPGGRAIITLPSWHPKADVSTVVPRLSGSVTSFQHSFLVSEHGARPSGATTRTSRRDRSSTTSRIRLPGKNP
ncbi:acetyl-CoA hydrolase [Amycolatopsis decaplanina DSM 44594]|uniref:Acetyl-CoA hydrolase n=1 Tax=Amycolatopsis decaplanina DSM 44594 TaxID=1284240 RepID=M2Z614_9PSEU|nr:acetyl-CoA hydrolase [Amycolatopsis decaplanina DSM 44594]